jgi:CheY-like chemotaxis protein
MEQAKILHCEDNKQWQDAIAMMLAFNGLHRVVATAESLGGSLKMIQAIKERTLDANVILLDGNLEGGVGMNHPRYIVSRARELSLELPVVGLSLDGLAEKGLRTESDIKADLLKDEVGANPDLLIQILNSLPEPEPFFTRDDA